MTEPYPLQTLPQTDDCKRPWRRETACKVPSYSPYPMKQTLDTVYLSHPTSLPPMSSFLKVQPPITSKSFSSHFFMDTIPELMDESTSPHECMCVEQCSRFLTLDDLRIEKLIGTGMYSKVYLAQSNSTKEYFALKVMPKAIAKKTSSETEIMLASHHPSIVKLWNYFEQNDNVYMLMEFASGGELFYHLRQRGKFDEATARFYASEVIMALEYLHSKGVVFRDLKLENLVLSSTGHVKLTDFGFAKYMQPGDRAFTLCGTPEYLAPEIIRGTGYDFSVDWWALGVLLFEMLSGYSPFYSSSPLEIYKNILSGRVRFPPGMNPFAKDLIKGLLSRDPRRRLGTVCNGISNLRNHPFFHNTQWTLNRMPPIIPVLSHKGDTSYFQLDEDELGDDGAGQVCEGGEDKGTHFPDF